MGLWHEEIYQKMRGALENTMFPTTWKRVLNETVTVLKRWNALAYDRVPSYHVNYNYLGTEIANAIVVGSPRVDAESGTADTT